MRRESDLPGGLVDGEDAGAVAVAEVVPGDGVKLNYAWCVNNVREEPTMAMAKYSLWQFDQLYTIHGKELDLPRAYSNYETTKSSLEKCTGEEIGDHYD